ncbi:MFS transporter [Acidipila sp. 4G-K13]|nr:MFS transporter [Paracidobacterium acidisoli]
MNGNAVVLNLPNVSLLHLCCEPEEQCSRNGPPQKARNVLFLLHAPEPDKGESRGLMSFTARQSRVFVVTWITYAGYYLCRKNLSIVLPALHGVSGSGTLELANIVFGYSLLYAIGQFVFGFLSDYAGAKKIVGSGLVLVIISNLLMSAHGSMTWLLIFACLNGIGQATGWSGLVKIMAGWFRGENRGVIMAWWGTNYVFGGFLATAFATWAITQKSLLPDPGWRRGFLFPALILLVITALFFRFVQDMPQQANPAEADRSLQPVPKRVDRPEWSDLYALLRTPSLWMIGLSYFFLEMCRYALMFWLPLYLVSHLKYSLETSGYVSSLYELVGIVGAVLAGYISDHFNQSRRAPVSAVMLAGLGIILFLQPALSRWGLVGAATGIALAGILSYGPDTLLSGAAAQDIGEVRAAATASGLIDGVGHMGALLSPYIVVFISRQYGWDALFMVLAAAAVIAGAILLPIWNLRPADRCLADSQNNAVCQSALS